MKIDLTAKQNFVSESSTKKQQANAKILFGSKGISILSKLEPLAKEKLLSTQGIDQLLAVLKTKDTAGLEKFAASASGKKFAANAKKVAASKSLSATLAALKTLKPVKSLEKLTSMPTSKDAPVTSIVYTTDISRDAVSELEELETNVLLDGTKDLIVGSAIFDEDDDEEYKVFILNGKQVSLQQAASVVAKAKTIHYFIGYEGNKIKWSTKAPAKSDFLLLRNAKVRSIYLDTLEKFKRFFKTYSSRDVYLD